MAEPCAAEPFLLTDGFAAVTQDQFPLSFLCSQLLAILVFLHFWKQNHVDQQSEKRRQ